LTPNQCLATLARLMAPDPVFFKPLLLAEQQGRLDGQLALRNMRRLGEIICDDSGTIDYHLQLGRDEFGFSYIRGTFEVALQLICQRCLHPFALQLSNEMNIGLAVSDEQLEKLPGHYEPMLLMKDEVSLLTLIEEEIILSIPMVPVHKNAACQAADLLARHAPKKENPFAVLKELTGKNS